MSSLPAVPGLDAGLLQRLRTDHNPEQLLWLSGYLYGLATSGAPAVAPSTETTGGSILVLFGSQTGNSKKVAHHAVQLLADSGWKTTLADMAEYPLQNLKNEQTLLVVVSTQGEGEPPASAEDFYRQLMGPRAPKLDHLRFAVCALGDSSYNLFCQTGKEIDQRLAALGATRLTDRTDCDADYETAANTWMQEVARMLDATALRTAPAASVKPAIEVVASGHSRKNPYEALVWEKIQLNGRGSEKETWHLELSIEGSDLRYQPGDALGVVPANDPDLVARVLKAARLQGSENVSWQGTTWRLDALLEHKLELTTLHPEVLKNAAKIRPDAGIAEWTNDAARLKNFLRGNDAVDLLEHFPLAPSADELVQLLRPLSPRLYSIASSPLAHEGEVHLTVAAVRYASNGRQRTGAASVFLADRVERGGVVPVFIEENSFFKLPSDDATDIIMVGPGTGVAPFRGFVAERAERGATGKNWLFFGNPRFTTDFLYQTEWLQHLKNGTLDRLDVAFSRDQEHKIYVQHRLLERSKLVFERLENGAYFYVCGDKTRMAADVRQALLSIIARESGKGADYAADYLKTLTKQRRFLEDVY